MEFGSQLINWYVKNQRKLPWRNTKDPYRIWLSEVILQQTRVAQGMSYYLKFVERFPNIFELAKAPQNEVLKMWQGLGYYNRAANLMAAAKTIANEHRGTFPANTKELMKIKGIGPYTAAAIASIAFDISEPVVDGNVFRVLARIFGISTPINSGKGKNEFAALAAKLMHKHPAGTFNQALMEFGALCCKPKTPNCTDCIFKESCVAFRNMNISGYPVKNPKSSIRNRYFYYFVIELKNQPQSYFYLKKRTAKDIWKNLYDFPLIEFYHETRVDTVLQDPGLKLLTKGSKFRCIDFSRHYKHQLTHQAIHAQFFRLIVDKKIESATDNSLLLVDRNQIINYPVPRLIDKYLQEQKIIIK